MSNQRYPLDWPQGYQRYGLTRIARPAFKQLTLTQAVAMLEEEVRRLQGKAYNRDPDLNLSTNIPLRNDGIPRADYLRSKIDDPGVAAYFKYSGEDVVLCCDKFARVEDNIKAIAITIEDMRRIERNGVSDFIKRSFTGFKALPAGPDARPWFKVLGFGVKPNPTPDGYKVARSAYRALAMHTDKTNPSDPRLVELVNAWEQAQKYFSNVM